MSSPERKSGHLIGVNRLLPPDAAATVRVRQGKVSVTDGPYAETKEALGGFYLVQAADLDEAIAYAAMIPGAREGAIEVRPIYEWSASALEADTAAAGHAH